MVSFGPVPVEAGILDLVSCLLNSFDLYVSFLDLDVLLYHCLMLPLSVIDPLQFAMA